METIATDVDSRVLALGYRLFDADNHYYEAEDAFTRYADPRIAHLAPRWVAMDNGQRRLVFGDKMNRFLGADQTFRQVGRPGSLQQGQASVAIQDRANLEPARPDFRDRDARLAVMDRQGLDATLLFPTLAVSVEALLTDDVDAMYGNLHAFNLWLDEDWGYGHDGRIYGVPLVSLLDPFRAVEELEFVTSRGARLVHLRSGPVAGRSPADPIYDRFWRCVSDAGVVVAYHASDASYRWDMAKVWGWGNINIPARNLPPLHRIISGLDRAIHDTIASLIYGKLFERFPELRMAVIELGCAWVPELFANFDRYGKGALDEDPTQTFKKHFWVAPFEDEDIPQLSRLIGIDRIMFGSDYPHTDGLADPVAFTDGLTGFNTEDVRKIMSGNARGLLGVS